MNALALRLLARVADRCEAYALEKYRARLEAEPHRVDEARRTRDRELGDVHDLRELVKQQKPIVEHEGAFVMLPAEPDDEALRAIDRAMMETKVETGDAQLARRIYDAIAGWKKQL